LLTQQAPKGPALVLDSEFYRIRFDKGDALLCANNLLKQEQQTPPLTENLKSLIIRYEADTTHVLSAPTNLNIVFGDTAVLNGFLIFGYVDACLIKRSKFSVLDKRSGKFLPWVRFLWVGDLGEKVHVLTAPDGTALYRTVH
jgi:hypothetical protein